MEQSYTKFIVILTFILIATNLNDPFYNIDGELIADSMRAIRHSISRGKGWIWPTQLIYITLYIASKNMDSFKSHFYSLLLQHRITWKEGIHQSFLVKIVSSKIQKILILENNFLGGRASFKS